MDEWFLSESRAFIVEEPSAWNLSANTGLYGRLRNDSYLQSHILPLLTVSDDSIYVIATAATVTYGIVDCYIDRKLKEADPALYGEKREQFKEDLKNTARQQREFLDFWYRMAESETRGLATYAHELTHLLVSKMMLNGYGARDGIQGEVYTRGMFEPYESNDPPAFNLNLIYDRQAYHERFHNAVFGRFQSDTDLQDYMSGILDVIYTLDYAEADVLFSKTPEEKQRWFHKLEQIEDTEDRSNQGDAGTIHYLDSVRELTLDEAKKLNTIEDLIRNSIIVSRYEVNGTTTTGTMKSNGYYVVPLFSANYAGVQNDNGVSGDVMIRRQAFELLAEYGYDDGMVPYISNQYKEAAHADQAILSDAYILKTIFGGAYDTMADFKMAMFQKRIDKVGELKPVTISWKNESVTIRDFQTLEQLMTEAVESDFIDISENKNTRAHKTQAERLKAEIFRAYLFLTKDFQESVYRGAEEPREPVTPTDPGSSVTPQDPPSVTPQDPPSVLPPADLTDSSLDEGDSGGSDEKTIEAGTFLAWVSSAKTSQTIHWKSVGAADGYYIYGAKSNAKFKLLKKSAKMSVSGNTKN